MVRWTIPESVTGVYDRHYLSSGPRPASFGTFEYRTAFELGVESVDVTHPPDADSRTREHVPSIRMGVELAVANSRNRGELITSLRIEILQVRRHPPDRDLRGSIHGSMLLVHLLDESGRQGPPINESWRSPTVVSLAAGIHTDRAFDRLPILADALEEAGCDHPDLLAHCRHASPHTDYCWLVDVLLANGAT